MKEFKLVDSTYAAEDAREVLLSLVSDKIRFLNTQVLSAEERFSGENKQHFKERAAYLEKEAEELRAAFRAVNGSSKTFKITCDVKIEEVEGKPEVDMQHSATHR